MKTCISTYSYHKLIDCGQMTYFSAMDKTKELGIDAIEFSIGKFPEGEDPKEYAVKLRDYAAKIGLPIASYTIGANFLCPDPAAEVERIKGQVDIAAILGAPVMRHDVAWKFYDGYVGLKTFDTVLPGLADCIRQVAEYAQSKGVRTCSENHGFFAQDSDRMIRLMEAVNHPNYRLLCDIGNFTCVDEDCAKAVGKVLPIIAHVHVKDMFIRSGLLPNPGRGWFKTRAGNYLRCTILGHGDVPVVQCLSLIKASGYEGYVSLEFEGIEDTLLGIEIGMENLKKYIASLD